jgi:hypothetical protein
LSDPERATPAEIGRRVGTPSAPRGRPRVRWARSFTCGWTRREVLGFDVIAAESEEGWAAFFKSLKELGLHGVKLVISDAHTGLKTRCAAC